MEDKGSLCNGTGAGVGERDEGPWSIAWDGLVTLIMKRGWNWLWLAYGSWLLKGMQPISPTG